MPQHPSWVRLPATAHDGMSAMRKLGIQVWPSPGVMAFMGVRHKLSKVAMLNIGLEDTLTYYTPEEFVAAGFKKTLNFGTLLMVAKLNIGLEDTLALHARGVCGWLQEVAHLGHMVCGGHVEHWFGGHACVLHGRGVCGWLQEHAQLWHAAYGGQVEHWFGGHARATRQRSLRLASRSRSPWAHGLRWPC